MRFVVRSISLLVATTAIAALLACGPVRSVTVGRRGPDPAPGPVVHEGSGHGPPPWAPAHGYRHKHQRAYQSHSGTVDLVFDSGLGVYVVVGLPNYYYWDGWYLRLDAGRWVQAPHLDSRWSPCPVDRVPGGLRAKADKSNKPGKGHAKGKSKGHGPAKRGGD
jgi:hypothetical protein